MEQGIWRKNWNIMNNDISKLLSIKTCYEENDKKCKSNPSA